MKTMPSKRQGLFRRRRKQKGGIAPFLIPLLAAGIGSGIGAIGNVASSAIQRGSGRHRRHRRRRRRH